MNRKKIINEFPHFGNVAHIQEILGGIISQPVGWVIYLKHLFWCHFVWNKIFHLFLVLPSFAYSLEMHTAKKKGNNT